MTDLHISDESWPDDPGLDTAVSHAVLRAVARGDLPPTLRVHQASPIVAFGRQDSLSAGYERAIDAARQQGFLAIERLAGGRAAVFHEGTLAFSWATPSADPRAEVHSRFSGAAAVFADALRHLGVDAQIGEVPGEYCPGSYSVNARGARKIVGIGQRLVRGGSHVGGVVVVDGAQRIADVLGPVYRFLGLDWDPSTVGAVADEVVAVGMSQVTAALVDAFERQFDLEPTNLPQPIIDEARLLAPIHLPGAVIGKSAGQP